MAVDVQRVKRDGTKDSNCQWCLSRAGEGGLTIALFVSTGYGITTSGDCNHAISCHYLCPYKTRGSSTHSSQIVNNLYSNNEVPIQITSKWPDHPTSVSAAGRWSCHSTQNPARSTAWLCSSLKPFLSLPSPLLLFFSLFFLKGQMPVSFTPSPPRVSNHPRPGKEMGDVVIVTDTADRP